MKGYNNMKKLIYSLALAASVLTMNSCIGDLDTVSLNETSKSDVDAYHTLADYEMGLAYIYGSFSLVSQSDPGSSDIAVDDAGQSEFTRQFVVLQEMSADALKCTWGDSYITDTQNASWTSTGNAATIAVYSRGMVTVTRANEFLKRTEGIEMEGLAGLRAEARFLRAYAYWVLLDLYGNPPFALPENINGEAPSQIGRPALAAWIAGELEDLAGDNSDMPEVGSVPYPRATKGAAQALLARLYLNYEVYTEGAETKWQEARDAAEKVINMGYTPCPNYAELFMQDNSENANATQEMIFAIAYDRDKTQSWGGTTHLVSGSLDDETSNTVAVALGFPEGTHVAPERWNGYHIPSEYVSQNFELSGVTWGGTGLGYDRATSDQRAFFCNIGCEEAFDNSTTKSGWRCWKFIAIDSKGELYTGSNFSSIDFPAIRLGEMYLIYAEAQARMDGGTTTDAKAMSYVKILRDRAGLSMPMYLDLDFILKERACELMLEGHRRTDLIRYGYFTSMSFSWPYKGGIPGGGVAIDDFRTIYPLLQSDLTENRNLKQNPGY